MLEQTGKCPVAQSHEEKREQGAVALLRKEKRMQCAVALSHKRRERSVKRHCYMKRGKSCVLKYCRIERRERNVQKYLSKTVTGLPRRSNADFPNSVFRGRSVTILDNLVSLRGERGTSCHIAA